MFHNKVELRTTKNAINDKYFEYINTFVLNGKVQLNLKINIIFSIVH